MRGRDKMNKKNPIVIKFIGWFQIFGPFAVLLTLNFNQTPPSDIRFEVPPVQD